MAAIDAKTAHTILTTLIPAITGIDGQCIVCIEKFVDEANAKLARSGSIPYRYEVVNGGWLDERVRVVPADVSA